MRIAKSGLVCNKIAKSVTVFLRIFQTIRIMSLRSSKVNANDNVKRYYQEFITQEYGTLKKTKINGVIAEYSSVQTNSTSFSPFI